MDIKLVVLALCALTLGSEAVPVFSVYSAEGYIELPYYGMVRLPSTWVGFCRGPATGSPWHPPLRDL